MPVPLFYFSDKDITQWKPFLFLLCFSLYKPHAAKAKGKQGADHARVPCGGIPRLLHGGWHVLLGRCCGRSFPVKGFPTENGRQGLLRVGLLRRLLLRLLCRQLTPHGNCRDVPHR